MFLRLLWIIIEIVIIKLRHVAMGLDQDFHPHSKRGFHLWSQSHQETNHRNCISLYWWPHDWWCSVLQMPWRLWASYLTPQLKLCVNVGLVSSQMHGLTRWGP
jgi:hypothetical protein